MFLGVHIFRNICSWGDQIRGVQICRDRPRRPAKSRHVTSTFDIPYIYIMYPLYLYSTREHEVDAARAAALVRLRATFCCYQHGCYTSMDATRCSESSGDREERLRRRRERERARRADETAEQRAHRLWQRRERDRARRALQSSERRERELQRMRATSHDRLLNSGDWRGEGGQASADECSAA